MTFHIITLFPEVFKPYLNESIVGIAQKKKLVEVKYYDLRKYSSDKKHKKIDDKQYGGGPGMVLEVEPLVKAIEGILKGKNKKKIKIVLLSASGGQFDNKKAKSLSKYKDIVFVAGRYEGVDERIKKIFKIEEVSIGPYVLTGGELPAMVMIDSITRQIKGVLGKEESLEEKRYGIGVPVYTRPETFEYKKKKHSVPKVLLSGNHAKIAKWREDNRKQK